MAGWAADRHASHSATDRRGALKSRIQGRSLPHGGLIRVATGVNAYIAFMTMFGQAKMVTQRFAVEEAAA